MSCSPYIVQRVEHNDLIPIFRFKEGLHAFLYYHRETLQEEQALLMIKIDIRNETFLVGIYIIFKIHISSEVLDPNEKEWKCNIAFTIHSCLCLDNFILYLENNGLQLKMTITLFRFSCPLPSPKWPPCPHPILELLMVPSDLRRELMKTR